MPTHRDIPPSTITRRLLFFFYLLPPSIGVIVFSYVLSTRFANNVLALPSSIPRTIPIAAPLGFTLLIFGRNSVN